MSIRSLFLVSALTLAACANQPTIAPNHTPGKGKADQAGATTDAFCGSLAGIQCANGLYCDVSLPNACDGRDLSGTCKAIDTACAPIAQPVCGCDSTTYANDCERLHNQVQLAHDGSCNTIANACMAVNGSIFESMELLPYGETQQGTVFNHWHVSFVDGNLDWRHDDAAHDKGTYSCTGLEIAAMLPGLNAAGTFHPDRDVLTWEGHDYLRCTDREQCARAAGWVH